LADISKEYAMRNEIWQRSQDNRDEAVRELNALIEELNEEYPGVLERLRKAEAKVEKACKDHRTW